MTKVFRLPTGIVTYVTVALAISLALTVLVFVTQNTHKDNFNQYLSDASEQQVLAHQIAKYAVESVSGNESSFVSLKEARDRSSVLMTELQEGSEAKDLPASPEAIQPTLQKVDAAWKLLEGHINSILQSQTIIVQADEIVENMKDVLPDFTEVVGTTVDQLVENGTRKQVYHATNLLYIAQRINTNLSEVLQGGLTTSFALSQLTQNTDELQTVVTALTKGNKLLGVTAVKNRSARASLTELSKKLENVRTYRDELHNMIAELLPALSTLGAVDEADTDSSNESGGGSVLAMASENLAALDVELMAYYRTYGGQLQFAGMTIGSGITSVLFTISTIIFLLLSFLIVSDARAQEQKVSEQNDKNQSAIRRLLGEMGNLANGDLSIEATVTEDITGAIADSINTSVESMRDVVISINDTSEKVSSSADINQSTIRELVVAAEQQDKDLVGANNVSKSMAETCMLWLGRLKYWRKLPKTLLNLRKKVVEQRTKVLMVWAYFVSRFKVLQSRSNDWARVRRRSAVLLA